MKEAHPEKKSTLKGWLLCLLLLFPAALLIAQGLTLLRPGEETAGSPLAANGELRIENGRLCNERGEPFAMQGVSMLLLEGHTRYVSRETFADLRDHWNVNTIRLCLVTESRAGGYCSGGDRASFESLIEQSIGWADELGLYLLLDWHVMEEKDPLLYKDDALAFFYRMASLCADRENVLYEICNEPIGEKGSWEAVSGYAREVIPIIRSFTDSIIIVGTPDWCQDLSAPLEAPLAGENIAYACHFYSGTHQDENRQILLKALQAGLPVIVTEFGLTGADGAGSYDEADAGRWMALLNEYGVGRIAYSLDSPSKEDLTSCCMIKSGCEKRSGWREEELNYQGRWVKKEFTRTSPRTALEDGSQFLKTQSPAFPWISMTAEKETSWSQGEMLCSKFVFTLTHPGLDPGPVNGWCIRLEFTQPVSIHESWNGVFLTDACHLTILPEEWDREMSPGQTLSLGANLMSQQPLYLRSAEIESFPLTPTPTPAVFLTLLPDQAGP